MEQYQRLEDVSLTESTATVSATTVLQQDFDVLQHNSSQTEPESSAVLSDILMLMKDVVHTFTCLQKDTQEELQKMTGFLCEEAKRSNGLLENILKELQELRHSTSCRNLMTLLPLLPDTKQSSINYSGRDPGKKLGVGHPLEKYYGGRDEFGMQDFPDTECRPDSTTVTMVKTELEYGGMQSSTQSDNTVSSRETDGSDKAGSLLDSSPSAQNIPPESGTRESDKHGTGRETPPFPASKCSMEVSGIRFVGSSDGETQHLTDALQRARAPDPFSSPRARSYDTILCLDISESMNEGGAFDQMVSVVNQFINGVEDIVGESGSEENIGVVTFGGHADIAQQLTNDFSRVRDAIERIEVGGKSPFFEAFVVALAAIEGKSGRISLSGEYDIYPRIIFISDGHATSGQEESSTRDLPADPANVRASLVQLMSELKPSESSHLPRPIVFVPVGTGADVIFMSSLATLSGGMMVTPDDITSLCRYFKQQEAIGKTIVVLRNKTSQTEEEIQAVIKALVSDLYPAEEQEVVRKVQEELQKSRQRKRSAGKPTDFEGVYEDVEGVMSGDRLPLGTRVVKGPDWHWGTQGSGGAGTVIQHENKKHPFTWVMWDTGEYNRYPYGPDMGYHIWKADDQPRIKLSDDPLEIGMTVRKGPQLDFEDVIKNATRGVIIRRTSNRKRLKVRWDNGVITECKVHAVIYCDPLLETADTRLSLPGGAFGPKLGKEVELNVDEDEDDESKIRVWQWRDESGNWRLYQEDITERLEKEFRKRRDGTLAITRSGKNYRVKFKQMLETSTASGSSREIKRALLPLEEFLSLKTAEELAQ